MLKVQSYRKSWSFSYETCFIITTYLLSPQLGPSLAMAGVSGFPFLFLLFLLFLIPQQLRYNQGADALLIGRQVMREKELAHFTGETEKSAPCFSSAIVPQLLQEVITFGNSAELGQV